ncbi:hypothetical protein F4821DRAFT_241735 [Hypoxylon rubiginosum]|uniref:Uncharacterized protein n=1 Tax=Hypoxylon rubiginosum TaxID=110542 RepID=A0ACC0CX63_9PEZI|nr:hypothetical protein F4821DRAFT_241735 [Hypoxylon rubiginosum]
MAPKSYFLLAEVATQDQVNHLLGRAVPFTSAKPDDENNPLKRPTEGRIFPHLPPEGPDLRQLDELLYPEGIKAKEATTLLRSARGHEAKVALNKALALFHSSNKSSERNASIPGFRRITMKQAPHRIEQLLKHPEYAEPIIEYFTRNPKGKLGIITSIICAMDMSLNVQHSQSRETGAELEVPSEALHAPPHTADLRAELSSLSTRVSETEGTYDGEVVVAVGYIQMTRKREPGVLSGLVGLFRPKRITEDDIAIGKELIHPQTMTVSLPATRIPGDQEVILGGTIDSTDQRLQEAAAEAGAGNDSDDDIALYA